MAVAHLRASPRLTARDLTLLAFCAEHRFVLAPQVALAAGISADAAKRRLAALLQAGCLSRERRYVAEPYAYAVTRTGIDAVGSALSPPRPLDPGTYAHDVGVGWLGAAAHAGRFGHLMEIVCERRMRSEDGRREPGAELRGLRYPGGGGAWGPRGGARLHYPDLTIVTAAGRRVAFELELHRKGAGRRERILSAYACDPRLDAVVYLVRTEAERAALERSARRVGVEDRLYVQLFAWAGDREPGMAPTRTRLPSTRTRLPSARTRGEPEGPGR